MFTRINSASINFMLAATIWLIVGVSMGLVLALEFVFPDIFRGVSWLVFGRLRQAHTNTVMFAFLSGGMMGIWLYIVPRLTGRQLWSEALGNMCVVLWNFALLIGIIGLLNGYTQSREYAELVWVVDVAVVVVLILNLVNIYMTVAHRVEPKLYVSLWYISGTVIWMPMLYFIGNVMWNPPTGALTGNQRFHHWLVLRPQRSRPVVHDRSPAGRLLHRAERDEHAPLQPCAVVIRLLGHRVFLHRASARITCSGRRFPTGSKQSRLPTVSVCCCRSLPS